MPTNGYFNIPFAIDGTRAVVPNDVDPGGLVSYDQGYPIGYEITPGDPGSLPVERDKMNELFYDVTSAIQQYQQHGTPPFIDATTNGGTAYSYSKDDRVLLTGVVYVSLQDLNTDTPPSSKWTAGTSVAKGGTGLSSITAHNLIVGNGTANVTLLPPSSASGIPLVSKGAALDPAYDTVSIAGGGTGSTTANGAKIALGILTFISSQQTITSGGLLTLTHGLGVVPTNVTIQLVCLTGEFGYSPGDITLLLMNTNDSGGNSSWPAIKLTSTQLVMRYGTQMEIANFTNGQAAVLTPSRWQAVFIAGAY